METTAGTSGSAGSSGSSGSGTGRPQAAFDYLTEVSGYGGGGFDQCIGAGDEGSIAFERGLPLLLSNPDTGANPGFGAGFGHSNSAEHQELRFGSSESWASVPLDEAPSFSSWINVPSHDQDVSLDRRSASFSPASNHAGDSTAISPSLLLSGMDTRSISPGDLKDSNENEAENGSVLALPGSFGPAPTPIDDRMSELVEGLIHQQTATIEQGIEPPILHGTPEFDLQMSLYVPSSFGADFPGVGIDNFGQVQWQQHNTSQQQQTTPNSTNASRGSVPTWTHSSISEYSSGSFRAVVAPPCASTMMFGPNRPEPTTLTKPSSRRQPKPSARRQQRPINSHMGSLMSSFATQRLRQAYNPELRREVAATRKRGSCFTCRVAKGKCLLGPSGDCTGCEAKRRRNPNLIQLCFKLDFDNCCVFRKSSPLHNVQGKEVMPWVTINQIRLEITMTGLIESQPLEVQCRHFRPSETDRVVKHVGGSIPGEVLPIPTYAAISFEGIRKGLDRHSLKWCEAFIGDLRGPNSSQRTRLLGETLHLARIYAERQPESLAQRALQLWTGAKITQIEKGLVGPVTLGMDKVQDEKSGLNGLVPVPPILDLQIDTVMIEWMSEMQQTLMKKLLEKISSKKPEQWFDIWLTVFVLAASAECVAREQEEFVKEFEDSKEEGLHNHVKNWSGEMIKHLEWSVRHLIFSISSTKMHKFPVDSPSLGSGARVARLDEKEIRGLEVIMASRASTTPIKMEYVTTAGIPTELSWIAPLFDR